jgi:hypothetical protein
VQYRFHRSAAFAPQSAAVPAERAVLKAELSKLWKVFVPKIRIYEKNFLQTSPSTIFHIVDTSPARGDKKKVIYNFLVFG